MWCDAQVILTAVLAPEAVAAAADSYSAAVLGPTAGPADATPAERLLSVIMTCPPSTPIIMATSPGEDPVAVVQQVQVSGGSWTKEAPTPRERIVHGTYEPTSSSDITGGGFGDVSVNGFAHMILFPGHVCPVSSSEAFSFESGYLRNHVSATPSPCAHVHPHLHVALR